MKAFSKTDVGQKREVNQDYVFTCDTPIGNLPNVYAVADGMGGHNAGDYASKYTVEVIKEEIEKSTESQPEPMIRHAIKVANQKIIEAAAKEESLAGMGTTIVVATIIEQTLYFANVGDSRLYLINDQITQLSKDHSLVEEMVRLGGIKPEEAKHHPDKNIITRAIGAKEGVEADFFEYRLHQNDTILMCSDGLSNMVEDEEIFNVVKGSRDIVEAVDGLIRTANNNGGNDNIGVVMVQPFAGEVSIC